jgi:hypothetical protein
MKDKEITFAFFNLITSGYEPRQLANVSVRRNVVPLRNVPRVDALWQM